MHAGILSKRRKTREKNRMTKREKSRRRTEYRGWRRQTKTQQRTDYRGGERERERKRQKHRMTMRTDVPEGNNSNSKKKKARLKQEIKSTRQLSVLKQQKRRSCHRPFRDLAFTLEIQIDRIEEATEWSHCKIESLQDTNTDALW